MAVVKKYARGYPNPDTNAKAEAVFGGLPLRMIHDTIAIASGDSATSTHYLGKIPSDAVLIKGASELTHEAITGVTDFDIGFANDTDALADGLNIAAAGTKSPLAAVTTPNLAKRAWELAGYSADPRKMLDVIATLNAAATAAGSVHYAIAFVRVV